MRHPTPMNLVFDMPPPAGMRMRQHLADQLRQALLRGQFLAADALPSSRVLAEALQVSRGTVVAVYEDLAGEGYLVIRPGSGTFAAEDFAIQEKPGLRKAPSSRSAEAPALPRDEKTVAMQPATINLWPGSPSTRFQQNRDWKAAWRAALGRDVPALPPDPAGIPETRELIAEHLAAARGMHCRPEDIVLTAGTSDGIGVLTHALAATRPAPLRIATEDPGYPAARRVMTRLGATTIPIPVRDGGMDVGMLAAAPGPIAAALLTASHQYPLGGRLPVAARLALLDWAEQEDSILIEDDYDSEFRHGAPALPAIASLDSTGRVVHIGSYSKTLTPWLRCGYLIIREPKLRTAALEARADLGQPVSGVTQTALAEFMRSGGLRRHLVRVGREYAHRRALVIEATTPLAPRIRLDAVEGGLHAVLSWDNGPSTDDVTTRLLREKFRVAPLSDYYYPDSPRVMEGIVFGYGAPTDLQLQSALRAILRALN